MNTDMDILTHALWTNLLFVDADMPTRLAAIGLSIMPDMVPFAPSTVRSLFRKKTRDPMTGEVKPDHWDYRISRWAYRSYDVTHSLPIWAATSAGTWLILGTPLLALLGWLGHILMDIPTHRKSFFGTRFLWPLSRYQYDGISWGEAWYLRINYGALLGMYTYLIVLTML